MRDAGATLLVTLGRIGGGTALTLEVATELERPLLHCDLSGSSTEGAAREVADYTITHFLRDDPVEPVEPETAESGDGPADSPG